MHDKKTITELIKGFYPYAKEHMGFDKPCRVFLHEDEANAANALGKSAFYDPGKMEVHLYTTGRHPKDILRSMCHELIHHTQNCRGEFDGVMEAGAGYAQKNEHLRMMEKEAYQGCIVLRDWEDSLKENK
jgi:hypothetical protein